MRSVRSLEPAELAEALRQRSNSFSRVAKMSSQMQRAWIAADDRFVHSLHRKFALDERHLATVRNYFDIRDSAGITDRAIPSAVTWSKGSRRASRRATRPRAVVTQWSSYCLGWRFRSRLPRSEVRG